MKDQQSSPVLTQRLLVPQNGVYGEGRLEAHSQPPLTQDVQALGRLRQQDGAEHFVPALRSIDFIYENLQETFSI